MAQMKINVQIVQQQENYEMENVIYVMIINLKVQLIFVSYVILLGLLFEQLILIFCFI